jgi:hypothetical protein
MYFWRISQMFVSIFSTSFLLYSIKQTQEAGLWKGTSPPTHIYIDSPPKYPTLKTDKLNRSPDSTPSHQLEWIFSTTWRLVRRGGRGDAIYHMIAGYLSLWLNFMERNSLQCAYILCAYSSEDGTLIVICSDSAKLRFCAVAQIFWVNASQRCCYLRKKNPTLLVR